MPFRLISKGKRKIYAKKIKGFWFEFSHNKIGLFGLALLSLYVIVAFIAPWLAPYNPNKEMRLASDFSMPQWVTVFPQYHNLPLTLTTPLNFGVERETQLVNVNINESSSEITLRYNGNEPTRFALYVNFTYPYKPMKAFFFNFKWRAQPEMITEWTSKVEYSLELVLYTPNGKSYSLWDHHYGPKQNPYLPEIPLAFYPKNSSYVHVESSMSLPLRLGYEPYRSETMVKDIFSEKGEYSIRLYTTFKPTQENATCEIGITGYKFKTMGLVHGILGTDHSGSDLFSQLVYGVRISLTIGLLAAIISTSIGILVGVLSGFLGGFVDETLMRLVDVLLCLPLLPLLLVLVTLFGRSVYYIILLISVFGWLVLSRLIRSQILYLREMPFVECAKAAGASKSYIMIKHLIPNIMPIALADMVLTVPGAILLEAALSFIGFGDPMTPTWGRMLQRAWEWGAFQHLAWWWIIPPGLAITFLCLAFVFMGHAIDEIVNPKLRRRR